MDTTLERPKVIPRRLFSLGPTNYCPVPKPRPKPGDYEHVHISDSPPIPKPRKSLMGKRKPEDEGYGSDTIPTPQGNNLRDSFRQETPVKLPPFINIATYPGKVKSSCLNSLSKQGHQFIEIHHDVGSGQNLEGAISLGPKKNKRRKVDDDYYQKSKSIFSCMIL